MAARAVAVLAVPMVQMVAMVLTVMTASTTVALAEGARTSGGDAPRTGAIDHRFAPWTDADGADHLKRDAARRAADPVPAEPRRAPAAGDGTPGDDAAARRASAGAAGRTADAAPDPAVVDALRRQGERERGARQLRGGMAPPPDAMPRIQPDAPPAPAVPPVPRVAIPRPGEPGGPPIALPTCGPAGCFDAEGRALPSAGGNLLIGPGGRPCVRTGASASC